MKPHLHLHQFPSIFFRASAQGIIFGFVRQPLQLFLRIGQCPIPTGLPLDFLQQLLVTLEAQRSKLRTLDLRDTQQKKIQPFSTGKMNLELSCYAKELIRRNANLGQDRSHRTLR